MAGCALPLVFLILKWIREAFVWTISEFIYYIYMLPVSVSKVALDGWLGLKECFSVLCLSNGLCIFQSRSFHLHSTVALYNSEKFVILKPNQRILIIKYTNSELCILPTIKTIFILKPWPWELKEAGVRGLIHFPNH